VKNLKNRDSKKSACYFYWRIRFWQENRTRTQSRLCGIRGKSVPIGSVLFSSTASVFPSQCCCTNAV